MCLTCWFFAFLITNTKSIVLRYNAQDNYYSELILKIKTFLNIRKVPRKVKLRIIHYIHYLKANSHKSNIKEEQILNSLSAPLKEEVF